MKNIIIGVIVFTIIFIGLGWLLVGKPQETKPVNIEVTKDDQTTGNASASATLIEYSDFQCPACAGYQPLVDQLKEDLGDQLKIIFRHFPLDSIHPNARVAAHAAEAAGNQNAFWKMHDLLFQNQNSWAELDDPTEIFTSYAKDLELDMDTFTNDLASYEVKDKVNKDYQSGLKAGVNSTPSFFINGKKINNPASYEVFKGIIEAEI